MKDIWDWVQVALTALVGFLGWFLGGFDGFLKVCGDRREPYICDLWWL